MNELRKVFSRFELARYGGFSVARRDEGQTLVEYGLILALIALVVLGVVAILGGTISNLFSNVASAI